MDLILSLADGEVPVLLKSIHWSKEIEMGIFPSRLRGMRADASFLERRQHWRHRRQIDRIDTYDMVKDKQISQPHRVDSSVYTKLKKLVNLLLTFFFLFFFCVKLDLALKCRWVSLKRKKSGLRYTRNDDETNASLSGWRQQGSIQPLKRTG